MPDLPDVMTGQIALLLGPKAERETMLNLTAVLALRGPVLVLDAGNQFNVYRITRQIRRHTPHLDTVLSQITVARAFTCYQVVSLCSRTPVQAAPYLVFDLLATFDDENVPQQESVRLLRLTLNHLYRLRQSAPVLISARPPRQPDRTALLDILIQAADQVLLPDKPT